GGSSIFSLCFFFHVLYLSSAILFSHCSCDHRVLHSFPTRRSSDLCQVDVNCSEGSAWTEQRDAAVRIGIVDSGLGYWCSGALVKDRKSTRLNSSHVKISYAVFCLKKKKKKTEKVANRRAKTRSREL